MSRPEPCFLCGATAGEIRVALVEWTAPQGTTRFTSGPRCTDHQACRGRVEDQGMSWEVDDRTLPRLTAASVEQALGPAVAYTDVDAIVAAGNEITAPPTSEHEAESFGSLEELFA